MTLLLLPIEEIISCVCQQLSQGKQHPQGSLISQCCSPQLIHEHSHLASFLPGACMKIKTSKSKFTTRKQSKMSFNTNCSPSDTFPSSQICMTMTKWTWGSSSLIKHLPRKSPGNNYTFIIDHNHFLIGKYADKLFENKAFSLWCDDNLLLCFCHFHNFLKNFNWHAFSCFC